MNTPAKPKPSLRIEATHIGPIMGLQQDLSPEKQNLIFARNGTGESFIARALRFFDQTVYSSYEQSNISDLLVSEESEDGTGSFRLYEGSSCVGSLELDTRSKTVTRSEPSYIFHVFTEDYIDEEVRNRLEKLDGEIQHEIIIGRENFELDRKETELSTKMETVSSRRETLNTEFTNRKNKHKADFAIMASLGAFKSLSPDVYFSPSPYTFDSSGLSLEELQSQYNNFKALPTDPILPTRLNFDGLDLHVQSVRDALVKITSPSTVASEFKAKIETDPGFFEAGLALYNEPPNECPFCTQPMEETAIAAVKTYLQYFQDEEAREKKSLNNLIRRLEGKNSKVEQWSIQYLRENKIYDDLRKYFPSFSDKKLVDPVELIDKLSLYLKGLRECVKAKLKDLTKSIDGPTKDIGSILKEVLEIAETNNTLLGQLETLANNRKSERKNIQNTSCKRFEEEFYEENRKTLSDIIELESDCHLLSEQIEELKLVHGDTGTRHQLGSAW